jgi:hypothetical protein
LENASKEHEMSDLEQTFDNELAEDDLSAGADYECDVCGELRPIAWHGFAYGVETFACAECAT